MDMPDLGGGAERCHLAQRFEDWLEKREAGHQCPRDDGTAVPTIFLFRQRPWLW